MQKKTLTTGQIAKFCDVNLRTVIRWIEKGLIKSYELPGRGDKRIPVESFIDFLQKNKMPIPEELLPEKINILVVDDDPEDLDYVKTCLKDINCDLAIADSGFQAGVILESHHPILVILDLVMPGISGFDVIGLIRSNEKYADVRILIVSDQNKKELQKAVEIGADDYLAKPYTKDDLSRKIKTLLPKTASETETLSS